MSWRREFDLLVVIGLGWALWVVLLLISVLSFSSCTLAPHFDALLRINPPPACPAPSPCPPSNIVLPPRT